MATNDYAALARIPTSLLDSSPDHAPEPLPAVLARAPKSRSGYVEQRLAALRTTDARPAAQPQPVPEPKPVKNVAAVARAERALAIRQANSVMVRNGVTVNRRLFVLSKRFEVSTTVIKQALRQPPTVCSGYVLDMLRELAAHECAQLIINPEQAAELLELINTKRGGQR